MNNMGKGRKAAKILCDLGVWERQGKKGKQIKETVMITVDGFNVVISHGTNSITGFSYHPRLADLAQRLHEVGVDAKVVQPIVSEAITTIFGGKANTELTYAQME